MKPSSIKSFLAFIGCIALSFPASAQGIIDFRNDPTTLISANGLPMPVSQQFIVAIFLAPFTTVSSTNIQATYTDPIWQNVGGYTTNSSAPAGAGRIVPRFSLDVGTPAGYPAAGTMVDFVIRGWSANAGYTWSEALANWNNGAPLVPMFIGSSTVGNDMVLTDIATATPFGLSIRQVPGFNMTFVPEPSTLTLAGLGLAAMCFLRRRAERE